jgi:hypothetical protein
MNELDLVRVKETVAVTPNFEDDPIEIKAGWGGTIIAHADLQPRRPHRGGKAS